MKYYKAKLNIENGLTVYGKLPYRFVIGYEDEEYAYFELLDEVYIPSLEEIEEITLEEYEGHVQYVLELEEQKRQKENQSVLEKIEQKKSENETLWQVITEMQLETMILNQQLTEAQLEIEFLKGGFN